MLLLGAPLSPFVRKTRIVAAEKNIDYDYDPKPSPLGWPEGYEKINPVKRIPALLLDPDNTNFAINDSSAICGFFEKLIPSPALYPTTAQAYGRALWLEELCDAELASKIGMTMFRPVFFNLAKGKPADYATANQGFEELVNGLLAYLEKQLEGRDWLAGDDFSIADIALTSQLMNMSYVGYNVAGATSVPNLAAHYERCTQRASIAGFLAVDKKFLENSGMPLPIQVPKQVG